MMAEYIDRQKLVNALRYEGTCRSKLLESSDLLRGLVIAILIAQKEVETADVEEVKHGHWILRRALNRIVDDDYFECSSCGYKTYDWDEPPYCQYCGAKMDGEEENG